MKKKIISFIFVFVFIFSILSCSSSKTEIHKFGDLYLKIPTSFKPTSFILKDDIVKYVSSYTAFDYKTQDAIFTIFDTRYKKEYYNMLDLKKSAEGVIRDLRNNNTIREFSIKEQKILDIGGIQGYYAKCEFFYGPNKTIADIAIFVDEGILQIVGVYNKSHKLSSRIIGDIIDSVTNKAPN